MDARSYVQLSYEMSDNSRSYAVERSKPRSLAIYRCTIYPVVPDVRQVEPRKSGSYSTVFISSPQGTQISQGPDSRENGNLRSLLKDVSPNELIFLDFFDQAQVCAPRRMLLCSRLRENPMK